MFTIKPMNWKNSNKNIIIVVLEKLHDVVNGGFHFFMLVLIRFIFFFSLHFLFLFFTALNNLKINLIVLPITFLYFCL